MNSHLLFSTYMQFKSQEFALRWAREHLPPEKYKAIYNSYCTLMKRTVIFVLACCVPIICIGLYFTFETPIADRIEAAATPAGATGWVTARCDYDGNFFWTHDSKAYEYPLAEYGLDPAYYHFGQKLNVYVNDDQEIIAVTATHEGTEASTWEVCISILVTLILPTVLILCVYRPIARRTFGKEWYEFNQQFKDGSLTDF